MNSSKRFSVPAEVAQANAGQALLPGQREARFQPATAEQSFVLSTCPAVVLEIPTHLIFSMRPAPERRRRFRREVLNACARY